LKAVSKPFYYYTGNWSREVDASKLRILISVFAKVINIEELNTHMINRRQKSFKLTIESYNDESIRNPANWPVGVVITRWRGPIKKRYSPNNKEETMISPACNLVTPNHEVNNTNKHLVNTQCIETRNKNMIDKNLFLNTMKQVIEHNKVVESAKNTNLAIENADSLTNKEYKENEDEENEVEMSNEGETQKTDLTQFVNLTNATSHSRAQNIAAATISEENH